MSIHPVHAVTRNTARMVLLNQENEIFLLKVDDPTVSEPGKGRKKPFWVTPGGKIESGETAIQALKRELFEETGINERNAEFGPCVWKGQHVLEWKGKMTLLVEKFFIIKVQSSTVTSINREEEEAAVIKEHKWFSLKELKDSKEIFVPKDLPRLISEILKGDTSEKEIDLTAPEDLYENP